MSCFPPSRFPAQTQTNQPDKHTHTHTTICGPFMPTDDRARWENAKMLTAEGERARGWKIFYVRLQSWQKRKALLRTHTFTPRLPVWCKNWSRAAVHSTHTQPVRRFGETVAQTSCQRAGRESEWKGRKRKKKNRGRDRWRERCTARRRLASPGSDLLLCRVVFSLCAHLLASFFLPPSSLFFFSAAFSLLSLILSFLFSQLIPHRSF